MKNETLLVTGASGHLGQLVLNALLKEPGRKIIATTRKPESLAQYAAKGVNVRAADFDKVETLTAAFAGADRLLLISTDAIGSRLNQHRNAIEAAVKAGVKHIVYTSFPHADKSPAFVAPEHIATEELIKKSGLSYTILRNNLYTDNLLGQLSTAFAMGAFAGTAGKGKIAYVTREDCADAAAGALASSENKNTVVDITGAEALGYEEIAAIAGEIAGRKLPYVDMSEADFKQALMKSGLPEIWADGYVSFDVTAKQGLLNQPSEAVLKYSGHQPKTLKTFLQENKASFLK